MFKTINVKPNYQHDFFVKMLQSSNESSNINLYRNNYYGRILGALSSLFPATNKLLGEKFFEQVALRFAKYYMPQKSHLHGYHFKFIKFVSALNEVSDIKYLKYLMYYEFLQERAHNAHKVNNVNFEIDLNDENQIVQLNHDIMLLKAPCNIKAVYRFCMDEGENLALTHRDEYYIISRNDANLIQTNLTDENTFSLAKILSKNKNLTLYDIFAKLSIGEDEFAKALSYFLINKLLVIKDEHEKML